MILCTNLFFPCGIGEAMGMLKQCLAIVTDFRSRTIKLRSDLSRKRSFSRQLLYELYALQENKTSSLEADLFLS